MCNTDTHDVLDEICTHISPLLHANFPKNAKLHAKVNLIVHLTRHLQGEL